MDLSSIRDVAVTFVAVVTALTLVWKLGGFSKVFSLFENRQKEKIQEIIRNENIPQSAAVDHIKETIEDVSINIVKISENIKSIDKRISRLENRIDSVTDLKYLRHEIEEIADGK